LTTVPGREPGGSGAEVTLRGLGRFPAARDRALASWVERLIGELAPGRDGFAVRFVGDHTMRAFNRDFRGQDKTTDVLSFPGERGPDGWPLGDVAISVPEATRQAAAHGHPLARELRLLILHGALHCLGHDHETDGGEMVELERRLRRRYLDHA
jgi:probable rRNA maturation factor